MKYPRVTRRTIPMLIMGLFSIALSISERPISIRIQPLFFEENSIILVSDSSWCMNNFGIPELHSEIDTLAMILKDNPTAVTELHGYADSNELSPDSIALARANYIRNELLSRSIEPARLIAVTYGSSRPLIDMQQMATFMSDEERRDARRHNRRVSANVVSFDYKP